MDSIKQDFKKRFYKLASYLKRHEVLLAAIVAACVIILSIGIGHINNGVVPTQPNQSFHYTQEPHNPLSFLSNWDGPDYLAIAKHGYVTKAEANFFPLYPLLIHLLTPIFRSPLITALLIAWLSLVGAIYFFMQILRELRIAPTQTEALKGLLFFVFFPTGIFLVATYTESLFALLALGSIYFTLKRRYIPAALMLLLANATHISGIFVTILIALLLIEQREKTAKVIATLAVGLGGLLGYMLYLKLHFNSALAFVSAQEGHGWLKHSYLNILTGADVFNILFVLLLILAAIFYWKKRKSLAIYSLLFLLIPILGRQYGGFNRYVLMAFPIQFMLYEYFKDKPVLLTYVLAASSVLWTYFALQYMGGYIGG